MKKIIALTVLASSATLAQNYNNSYGVQPYNNIQGTQPLSVQQQSSNSYGTQPVLVPSYNNPSINQQYGVQPYNNQQNISPYTQQQSSSSPTYSTVTTSPASSPTYSTVTTSPASSPTYSTVTTPTTYSKPTSYNTEVAGEDVKAITIGITYSPLNWQEDNYKGIKHPKNLLNYHIGGMYIPAGNDLGGYGEYSQGTTQKSTTKDGETIDSSLIHTNYTLGLAKILNNESINASLGSDTNIVKIGFDISKIDSKRKGTDTTKSKYGYSYGLNTSIISYWDKHGLELGVRAATLAGKLDEKDSKNKFSDGLKDGVTLGIKASYSYRF